MDSLVFGRQYPTEDEVARARDILKPPGILSKAYNKMQLKKVERDYPIDAKPNSQEALVKKYQTDRLSMTGAANDVPYFQVKTKAHAPVSELILRSLENGKNHELPSTYDRIKHMEPGYNPKLHRDDRKHAKLRGLNVNLEETTLAAPKLSSSIYGHPVRSQIDFPSRTHSHVEVCQKDFFRLTGTNIGKEE